jgi:predicted RecA/RadA family phage recombinase
MVSGTVYQIGRLVGVAGFTTKTTTGGVSTIVTGVLWLVGVFNLPKATGETWAFGDLVYWSPTNQYCTKTNASSDALLGVSVSVVGTATITPAPVRLNGAFVD